MFIVKFCSFVCLGIRSIKLCSCGVFPHVKLILSFYFCCAFFCFLIFLFFCFFCAGIEIWAILAILIGIGDGGYYTAAPQIFPSLIGSVKFLFETTMCQWWYFLFDINIRVFHLFIIILYIFHAEIRSICSNEIFISNWNVYNIFLLHLFGLLYKNNYKYSFM